MTLSDIAIVDPDGSATKLLTTLGFKTHGWKGTTEPLVVIGRNALKQDPATAGKLET